MSGVRGGGRKAGPGSGSGSGSKRDPVRRYVVSLYAGKMLEESLRFCAYWLLFILGVWILVGIANLAFDLPEDWKRAISLFGLSVWPVFFFSPLPRSRCLQRLRSVDPYSALEAYLEAVPAGMPVADGTERPEDAGPDAPAAREMVSKAARAAMSDSRPVFFRCLKNPFRGLGKAFLALLAALCLLEAASAAFFGRQSWSASPGLRGSRAAEADALFDRDSLSGQEILPDPQFGRPESPSFPSGEENASTYAESDGAAAGQAGKAAGKKVAQTGQAGQTGRNVPPPADMNATGDSGGEGSGQSDESAARAAEAESGSGKKNGDESMTDGSGDDGRSDDAAAGRETTPGAKARRGASAGWEESGDTGAPDALPEYRAVFERIATDAEGEKVQATGAMHLAELQELQRAVYAGLAELPSVDAAEDAWAIFLRERWVRRGAAR
ncbi:MAG: hypothetical protein WAZ99_05600 [Rectinemataceae bacterium]